jgi:hypothetical protein
MTGLVTAEAIPVPWETNAFRVHDVLDMPLPRSVTGFAVRVVAWSRLMAMAGVTVLRAQKFDCTLDSSCSVVVLLVGSGHDPGARKEHDKRKQGDGAPNDRRREAIPSRLLLR